MSALDYRLENWGRWLRGSPVYRQCASLEGNYRSPQCWFPPGPRPPEAWAADAWEVCLAVATLETRYHLILELRYVSGQGLEQMRAIFNRAFHERIRYQEIAALHDVAHVLVEEALSQPIVIRRVRAVERVRAILRRSNGPLQLSTLLA